MGQGPLKGPFLGSQGPHFSIKNKFSTKLNRFKFDFNVGKQTPDYSYNWPYDFFSLVELVKMSADMSIGDIGGFG